MDKKFYKTCLKVEITDKIYKYKDNKSKLYNFFAKKFRMIQYKLFAFDYPNYDMIRLIRKMQYYNSKKGHINKRIAVKCNRKLTKKYSSYINPLCEIDVGLTITHPVGIVIGHSVKIGKNFIMYHRTTIGGGPITSYNAMPTIGDNCIMYSNSGIFGKVTVADNVVLGTNSVILKDALESGLYVGSPAKKIK